MKLKDWHIRQLILNFKITNFELVLTIFITTSILLFTVFTVLNFMSVQKSIQNIPKIIPVINKVKLKINSIDSAIIEQVKDTLPNTTTAQTNKPTQPVNNPTVHNEYITLSNPSIEMSSNQSAGPFTARMSDGSNVSWSTPEGTQHLYGYSLGVLSYSLVSSSEFYIRADANHPSGVYYLKIRASSPTKEKSYETQIKVTVNNTGTFTISADVGTASFESGMLIVPYTINRINGFEPPIEVTAYPEVLLGQDYVGIRSITSYAGDYGFLTLYPTEELKPGIYKIIVHAFNSGSTIIANDYFNVVVE